MAQAERLLLAREARLPGPGRSLVESLQLVRLAAGGERRLELELLVEMVLDHALVAAGDEDEVLDAGFARFVHHVLDQRAVDDRQHLLRHGLGGGQEARAEPGDGEHGLADAQRHSQSSLESYDDASDRRLSGTLELSISFR